MFLFLRSCSFSVTSISAHAQNAPAPGPDTVPTIRETVVVTATGRDMPESKVGASITVLDRQEIEQRHALSTIDLAENDAWRRRRALGRRRQPDGVFVRGGESTYNKVLLDGMPLNEPGGAFNFASLSPENIERIEVLRGAHSALFGSDAMASVIQLFSVRPGDRQAAGEPHRGRRQLRHRACCGGRRRANRRRRVLDLRLESSDGQSRAEQREQDIDRVGQRHAHDELGRIGAVPRTRRVRPRGHAGATAFGRADMDAFFRHRDGSFLGGWNQPLGSRVTQQTSYSYIMTKYRSTNLIADPPYTPRFGDLVAPFPSSDFLYDSETDLERHHFQYRADAAVAPNQTLTAAFAYDGERGVLTNHRSTAAPQRPSRNNTGTTVQYEASGERVSVVGGIRFENNGSFGFYVAPRVAASWLVSSGPQAATARRHTPSRQRRTRHQGAAVHSVVQPVAELPRQSRSRSPNGRADSTSASSSGFARNRVALEATYFANHFDDLISLGPFDPVTFNAQYENIGETRASGLELVGTAFAGGGLRFSGGYTFLDSKVIRSISSSPIFAPGRSAVPAAASLRLACRRRTRAIA